MPRFLRNATLIVLPVLTLLLGWHLGVRYHEGVVAQEQEYLEDIFTGEIGSGETITNPEEDVDITLMWSVWRLMLKHYIHPEELDPSKMLFGATSGLVNAAGDPYSVFMPPQENQDFRDALNGHLEGIGAELTQREDQIVVVAPLRGSPAEAAGVLPEDSILAVDGEDISGKSLNDVVDRIRGPQGMQVTITVLHAGELESTDITITRDDIQVPSVESRVLTSESGDSVGYIIINRFGEETTREVEAELQELLPQNLQSLIVDVRFNGGGYLDRAVELSSLFMKQGKVVSMVRREGDPSVHYVTGRPTVPDLPLVVLINEGSASASEILAGALQDSERATIIGKKSFGKGTVQEVFDLPGGTSIRITTAKWLTPSGKDLSQDGIHPDIEVERTVEDAQAGRDPQLERAVEVLSGSPMVEETE